MKHRNIIVLITAVLLLFLLVFPSVYMQAECSGYIESIDGIRAAVRSRDAGLAERLCKEKLSKWEVTNGLILAFTPHVETEFIQAAIIGLSHSVKQKDYTLALERADVLSSMFEHLIQGSRLSFENLF